MMCGHLIWCVFEILEPVFIRQKKKDYACIQELKSVKIRENMIDI